MENWAGPGTNIKAIDCVLVHVLVSIPTSSIRYGFTHVYSTGSSIMYGFILHIYSLQHCSLVIYGFTVRSYVVAVWFYMALLDRLIRSTV